MPKIAREKTAAQVRQITRPGLHAVGGAPGLLLQVKDSGARSWIVRVMVGGRRRMIGLGSFPDVSLSEARQTAGDVRKQIRNGVDPVAERQAARDALRASQASAVTFDEAARQCHAARSQEFRNNKHAAQWKASLDQYASPIIGNLPVSEVGIEHIVKILEPLWTTKTETAVRLRGRIEAVLAWATVRGYRSGDNPARWKGHLDAVLPQPSKIAKVEHFKAVPVDEIGAFMEQLRQREGIGARALEFVILTAARSGEVRGVTWDEIDFNERIWTVPGERMKAGRPHTVPLSDDAIRLLKSLHRRPDTRLLFPSTQGKKLSDATLGAVLKRMGRTETVHGFRSTFADWCSERTSYPSEVREMALAHTIENKTEKAYRRGALLQKRRRLMQDWAKFVATVQQANNVTGISAAT